MTAESLDSWKLSSILLHLMDQKDIATKVIKYVEQNDKVCVEVCVIAAKNSA